MNTHLLLILADALEKPLPKPFSLHAWDCGSMACAIGQAALLPEFQEAGFEMIFIGSMRVSSPTYKHWDGWSAVERLLGLHPDDAERLFDQYHYNYCDSCNPLAVAARIRKFVAEHEE